MCHFYFFIVQCALEGILHNTGRKEIGGLLDTGLLPRRLSSLMIIPLDCQNRNKDILEWLWPQFLQIQQAMFENWDCLNLYNYI